MMPVRAGVAGPHVFIWYAPGLIRRSELESFVIHSASQDGNLEFFNRLPVDKSRPIEEFSVRITQEDLFALARVWGGYTHGHPASLFADMASQWAGWQGELEWKSLEGEMTLRCAHDSLGHISIRTKLRSGPMDWDWVVQSTTMAEAAQLESLARHAANFFGKS
jgi:hypothetical protein